MTSIGWRDWLISVIIGLISLPLGALIKVVPTEPIGRLVYGWGWLRDPSKLEVEVVDLGKEYEDEDRPEPENESNKWNPAIDRVRDNLALFSQIRGPLSFSFTFFLSLPPPGSLFCSVFFFVSPRPLQVGE